MNATSGTFPSVWNEERKKHFSAFVKQWSQIDISKISHVTFNWVKIAAALLKSHSLSCRHLDRKISVETFCNFAKIHLHVKTKQKNTYFWDHSRFMPDFNEKAVSISCCGAVRVGTGLEDGVGAGATKARRISSVVAIRMKSWSLTMHKL